MTTMNPDYTYIHMVAGVVIKQDKKYLLIKEAQAKARGLWNLPAGHVDVGHTLEQTAIKEAKEESGFDVEIVRKLGVWQESEKVPSRHIFEAEIIGGELKFPEDEILDAQWISFEEIEQLDGDGKLRGPFVYAAISEVERGHLFLDSAVFYSNDIEKIIPFYRDILGFQLEYQQEGKFVSFIFPNGGRLGIKTRKEDREVPGHQTVFVGVDNIEQLYEDLKKKNTNFAKQLTEVPWGKEVSVLDEDGNKIEYIQRN